MNLWKQGDILNIVGVDVQDFFIQKIEISIFTASEASVVQWQNGDLAVSLNKDSTPFTRGK